MMPNETIINDVDNTILGAPILKRIINDSSRMIFPETIASHPTNHILHVTSEPIDVVNIPLQTYLEDDKVKKQLCDIYDDDYVYDDIA